MPEFAAEIQNAGNAQNDVNDPAESVCIRLKEQFERAKNQKYTSDHGNDIKAGKIAASSIVVILCGRRIVHPAAVQFRHEAVARLYVLLAVRADGDTVAVMVEDVAVIIVKTEFTGRVAVS